MFRLLIVLISLVLVTSVAPAGTTAPPVLKDLYFGEAFFHALKGDWFDAIARLDTELSLFHGLDEPERDTLYYHINQAEFAVGDFELAYRMHQRAGRAITAVIEGNVDEAIRNEAIFRLARMYFQKDQPQNALFAVERINGDVPAAIRDDLAFLRAQILTANGRFAEAADMFGELQGVKSSRVSAPITSALQSSGKARSWRAAGFWTVPARSTASNRSQWQSRTSQTWCSVQS